VLNFKRFWIASSPGNIIPIEINRIIVTDFPWKGYTLESKTCSNFMKDTEATYSAKTVWITVCTMIMHFHISLPRLQE
jgi:transcriptional regulator CtsR